MTKNIYFLLIMPILFYCSLTTAQQISDKPVNYNPFGKLIDVGGYKLHLNCTGQGPVTVILISGASNFSFDWIQVQSKISKSMRVCSYDRPSLAWSDAGPMPRTLVQDVYELHELLKNAKIKAPLILVGHSIGGIIARKYANEFPKDVEGMVLIDATSENSILNINGKTERVRLLASTEKKIPPVKRTIDTLTKIPDSKELEELWKMFGKPSISYPFDHLPPDIQKIRIWAQSLPKYQIADTYEFLPEEFAAIYANKSSYNLGNKPIVILYSSKNEYPIELGPLRDSLMNDKLRNQHVLSNLSNNSKIIATAASGHEIFLTEPDLVVGAINQVAIAMKTKSKPK